MKEINIYEYVEAVRLFEEYDTNKTVKSIDAIIKIGSDERLIEILIKVKKLINNTDCDLDINSYTENEEFFISELNKLKSDTDTDNILKYIDLWKQVAIYEKFLADNDINPFQEIIYDCFAVKKFTFEKYPQKDFFKMYNKFLSTKGLKNAKKNQGEFFNVVHDLGLNTGYIILPFLNNIDDINDFVKYVPKKFSYLAKALYKYYDLSNECMLFAEKLYIVGARPNSQNIHSWDEDLRDFYDKCV